jgi:hypothetical protein
MRGYTSQEPNKKIQRLLRARVRNTGCIQSLGKIVSAKPSLSDIVASRLISFDIMAMKETMRKSILLDILNLLLIIREEQTTAEVESFISNALSGEILDKKTSKQIENLLG